MNEIFTIKECDVNSNDADILLQELNNSLEEITGCSGSSSFSKKDVSNENGVFLIGYLDNEPVACGALRELSKDTAEIKRVFARKNNVGAAHKIIEALETFALQKLYRKLILETRVVNQHAVDFYYSCGYEKCENFGKYKGRVNAICFQKEIQ